MKSSRDEGNPPVKEELEAVRDWASAPVLRGEPVVAQPRGAGQGSSGVPPTLVLSRTALEPASPEPGDRDELLATVAIFRPGARAWPDLVVSDEQGEQVTRLSLGPAGLSVGREEGNGLILPSPFVSRRHFRLEWRGEDLLVTDVGSRRGTWLDDVRLVPEVPVRWLPGQQLRVEPYRLRVEGPRAGRRAGEPGPGGRASAELVGRGGSPAGKGAAGDARPGMAQAGAPGPGAGGLGRPERSAVAGGGAGQRPAAGQHGGGMAAGGPAGAAGEAKGGRSVAGPDIGDRTLALSRQMRETGVGLSELQALAADDRRLGRMEQAGLIEPGEARVVRSLAGPVMRSRRRQIWGGVVAAVLVVGLLGGLVWQRWSYRERIGRQQRLLADIVALNREQGRRVGEAERMQLVGRQRELERELLTLRTQLEAADQVSLPTYSSPLGMEIQTALEGFGKQNYLVPEDFIAKVEGQIQAFTRTSARSILRESFANKPRHEARIKAALEQVRMPQAFLYLAMHESKLDAQIVSATGARGLWQLMPGTARELGLKVPTGWAGMAPEADERTDPDKNTRAGVEYIRRLYLRFGDVALTMCAYNAGPGTIQKALYQIRDPINERDFWFIYRLGLLPEETAGYVPKIIATMIIDQHRSRYGF